MDKKLIIISPFYNAGLYIKNCIDSLKSQTYTNFKAYFIDDMSIDNSCELFYQNTNNDNRFYLIKNTEKKYAIKNIYDCIYSLNLDKDDIIIQLDGDDWLYSNNSLNIIVNTYREENCWVTYGSYINASNSSIGIFSKQIPNSILDNQIIRTSEWMTSHLKTFKFGLFNKINILDFKDENGEWIKTTHDLAIMIPMIEMAQYKSKFIPDILYTYNDLNELNDFKKNKNELLNIEKIIRNKKCYKKIISL